MHSAGCRYLDFRILFPPLFKHEIPNFRFTTELEEGSIVNHLLKDSTSTGSTEGIAEENVCVAASGGRSLRKDEVVRIKRKC